MKIVKCSICDKDMEVDDRIGESCRSSHQECLEEALRPTREWVQTRFEALREIQEKK